MKIKYKLILIFVVFLLGSAIVSIPSLAMLKMTPIALAAGGTAEFSAAEVDGQIKVSVTNIARHSKKSVDIGLVLDNCIGVPIATTTFDKQAILLGQSAAYTFQSPVILTPYGTPFHLSVDITGSGKKHKLIQAVPNMATFKVASESGDGSICRI